MPHDPDPEPILRAVHLTRTYFLGGAVYAVNDISFDVWPGEFTVIVGASGSGKTTLLSLLGGLDRPNTGDVVLSGVRYSKLGEDGLAVLRRRSIGFVFQFFNLIPHLTARENVILPMRFAGVPQRQAAERADHLLEEVGLAARRNHRPEQLSGGEQQRVAIARALSNRPKVVLADEPTGNLDSRTRTEIVEMFRKLNRDEGQTFVVVTHDESMRGYADRVLELQDGRLVGNGQFLREGA